MDVSKTTHDFTPFGDIALCFSGGGFRAASFSLGCLQYLHAAYLSNEENKLLHHVSFISSASGGTIPAILYSAYLCEGKNFELFCEDLKKGLDGEKLLQTVFDFLNNKNLWKKDTLKGRNIINAFSLAYNKELYDNRTMGVYYQKLKNTHLETVCFNSTEFYYGLSFRFQTNGISAYDMRTGNAFMFFNNMEVINKIKLGDVLAASSCFPAGFEPIQFPTDFTHKELSKQELIDAMRIEDDIVKKALQGKDFCLMDGGIDDNIGIDSMLLANTNRTNDGKKVFDLAIICDVSGRFLKPLKIPAENKKSFGKNLNLSKIISIFKFSVPVFILCIVFLFFRSTRIIGLLFIIPSFILSLVYLIPAWLLRKEVKKAAKEDGNMLQTFFKYLSYFLNLRLTALLQMIMARTKSVVMLSGDIFLKQIRRLQYSKFYSAKDFDHRRISNLIYTLAPVNDKFRNENLKKTKWYEKLSAEQRKNLEPSAVMQKIAAEAKAFGTTLWFDKKAVQDKVRDKIIATGYFTCCFSLLCYTYELQYEVSEKFTDDINALQGRLERDWGKLKNKPV